MPTMPKKTKKQKMRATEHRKIQPAAAVTHLHAPPAVSLNVPGYQLHSPSHTAAIKYNTVDLAELQIIRQDLIKTIIFAAIAIMIEIILSYFIR